MIRRMLAWTLAVLALLAVAGWIVSWRFDAGIEAELQKVRATPAATAERVDLPPLLATYRARTGVRDGAGMRWFRVEQVGEMRLKPDGEWKAFFAVQLYAVAEPAFVWKARFAAFKVVDSLVNGTGRLEARLLGVLPVMRAASDEATRAQLLRYLAEVVWVPRAISSNRCITWRQLSDTEAVGVIEHAGARAELRFLFDGQGDIERVEGMRGRGVGDKVVETAWIGAFSEYRTVGGVRIPTRGEVQWVLDSGPFTYWRGTVTCLDAL